MSTKAWKFWVDRGGTFTDLIGCDSSGKLHIRKVLSEGGEDDPAVQAMRELLAIPAGEPIGHAQIESAAGDHRCHECLVGAPGCTAGVAHQPWFG